MNKRNRKESLKQNLNKENNQNIDSNSEKQVNELMDECTTIEVDGRVTICCCDDNGDNCSCTGIV